MAAVRFTLLVAALLSLMFLATPFNVFAAPLNTVATSFGDCNRRYALCAGFKHEQCNECVRDCWHAEITTQGNFRRAAGWWRMRCKTVMEVLAARGEAGN